MPQSDVRIWGTIRCASQQGQWTEFVLSFPRYDSDTVNEIKTELLKTKSLIYIGSNQAIVRELNQLAVEDEFGLPLFLRSKQ